MRTGRPPESGEAREVVVHARFSKIEAAALDRSRETESRSDFIRQAVKDRVQKRGTK